MRIVPPGAQSARSVGLLSAIMAFFAIVVLALALAAGRLAETWEGSLADTATLQILGGGEDVEEQARAALDVLRTTPGVRGVRMIEVAEQRALLEPWLGSEAALDSLPLPLLIEVATDPDRLNIESLTLRLQAEAPAAVYDDHGAWRASAGHHCRAGCGSLPSRALRCSSPSSRACSASRRMRRLPPMGRRSAHSGRSARGTATSPVPSCRRYVARAPQGALAAGARRADPARACPAPASPASSLLALGLRAGTG